MGCVERMPAISVIVPVYKVEPYLHQCVDSILGQTFRNFELILVDDGSPDGCPVICDGYARADSRVRVIHKPNGGLSSARNAGLDCAKGEFIAFVDSDDWVHPEYLERMLIALQAENADMAVCNLQLAYAPEYVGEKVDKDFPVKDEILNRQQMLNKLMLKMAWFYAIACNKLYRRSIFQNLRFPAGYIHEDAAVIHRVIGQCERIVSISKRLYYYRQVPGSIMGQGVRVQSSDSFYAYVDRICYCAEQGWTELMEKTLQRYIYAFFDLYFRFPRTEENEEYFQRMDNSLKTALPYILKSKSVSLRHKVYLSSIRVNPKIYTTLKRLLRG